MTTTNSEILQQYLIELNQAKKELVDIRNKLGNILRDTDETLAKLGTSWSEHHEKYCNDLVKQLKDRGITLTDDEKNILHYGGSTASSATEIRKNLGVNIPNKVSDFATIACSAVAAALSRTLQKLDTAYNIIKSLKVIDEENDYSDEFKAVCKKQFGDITKATMDLKNKVTAIQGLSSDKQELIEKITTSALALEKAAAATAAQTEKQVTQAFDE